MSYNSGATKCALFVYSFFSQEIMHGLLHVSTGASLIIECTARMPAARDDIVSCLIDALQNLPPDVIGYMNK